MIKKNKWKLVVLIVLGLLVIGEFVSRVLLGLGDPPLSITHPKIEYLCAPATENSRFGNRYAVNEYGQRSDSYSKKKLGGELRVLVLGDSVPNGGGLTDQSELATEILKTKLSEQLAKSVVVANISAGSWGPPNLLAYLEEYGAFEADVAVIVLNRDDLYDQPTFEELNRLTHPTEQPISALWELFERYLYPRVIAMFTRQKPTKNEEKAVDRPTTLEALSCVVSFLKERGVKTSILYHPSESEIEAEMNPSYSVFRDFAENEGLGFGSMESVYKRSSATGEDVFRDEMHPNANGQEHMAQVMLELLSIEKSE